MAEISITRALVELKTLDDRISKEISNSSFVGVKVKGGINGSTKDEKTFCSNARAAFASIRSLIARRNQIKARIVESNSSTKVTIGDVQYTVAEAIERKNSIGYEEALLESLYRQKQQCVMSVETINIRATDGLNNILANSFSGDSKQPEMVESLTNTYKENNFASLVDPLDIQKQISELEESIRSFKAEVDFALSEVNAVTKITV